jgi:hypothetical protein
MKHGTGNHRKTRQLAEIIFISFGGTLTKEHAAAMAIGVLEHFWERVGDERPAGDLGGIDPATLASWALWPAWDAQTIIDALDRCGFIDALDGRYVVHDWAEHCEHYIHTKLARTGRHFWCGAVPSLRGLSSDERVEAKARFGLALTDKEIERAAANGTPVASADPARIPSHAVPSHQQQADAAVDLLIGLGLQLPTARRLAVHPMPLIRTAIAVWREAGAKPEHVGIIAKALDDGTAERRAAADRPAPDPTPLSPPAAEVDVSQATREELERAAADYERMTGEAVDDPSALLASRSGRAAVAQVVSRA